VGVFGLHFFFSDFERSPFLFYRLLTSFPSFFHRIWSTPHFFAFSRLSLPLHLAVAAPASFSHSSPLKDAVFSPSPAWSLFSPGGRFSFSRRCTPRLMFIFFPVFFLEDKVLTLFFLFFGNFFRRFSQTGKSFFFLFFLNKIFFPVSGPITFPLYSVEIPELFFRGSP